VPYPVPTGSRLSGPRVNIPGLGSYFPLYADRPGYWAIEYYVNGRPRRESVGRILRKPPAQTTEAEAKRCLTARRRQDLAGDLPPVGAERLTIAKLFDLYLAERISEGIKKPNYVRLNSRPILDAVGHLLAANLQTQHCTDWILAMREKGWSNATISTNLGYLRAAYRYGCQRATPQLVAAMPYIPAGGRARRRTGYVGPGAAIQVFAAAESPILGLLWAFHYECGWRPGEVRTLRWEYVDWERGVVTLPDTKNDEPRVLPIAGRIREILEQARALRAVPPTQRRRAEYLSPWVFHSVQGGLINNRIFYRAWHKATAAAGISGRIPHDLRRSFTTDANAAEVDVASTMDTQGHLDPRVSRRYTVENLARIERAITKTARYRATQRDAAMTPTKPRQTRRAGMASGRKSGS